MPIAFDSKKIGRKIWVAENIDAARDLYRSGERDPIFLQEEIPLLQDACDQTLAWAARMKDVFPGAQILKCGPPGLPAATRATYDPSRQRKKFAKGNRTPDN